MKLTKIHVRNLRCISELTFDCYKFTTLIGPNNAGKSTVMRAIQLLLENDKPELSEWPNSSASDVKIEIEATFSDLKEWEKQKPGIAGIVYNNAIQLKYIATKEPNGKVSIEYLAFRPEESINGWTDSWGDLPTNIKTIAAEFGIDTAVKWKNSANKEKVRAKIREAHSTLLQYSDPQWTGENISIPAALQQGLPQVLIVPAITDPAEATKPASKTVFGTLLSKIVIPSIQSSTEYQNLKSSLSTLKTKMSTSGTTGFPEINSLLEKISKRMNEVFAAKVTLTLDEPDFEKILSGIAGLKVNDGAETPIHLQGHGVQRSVIFALIETLSQQTVANDGEAENKRSTVLLFEEPELFMHPHLMRRLRDSLIKMSEADDFQVVCTTHSPFLINIAEEPKSLVIFQRQDFSRPPKTMQLKEDPFIDEERDQLRAALDFHPSICEVFFAKRTILVEGDTEKAVLSGLPKLWDFYGLSAEKIKDTTIISCGGKWTIAPIARLLTKFGIPFRVVHDEDAKNRSKEVLSALTGFDPYCANARIKAAMSANPEIFLVKDTFEDVVFDHQDKKPGKDKPYQSWKLLNNDLNSGAELIKTKPILKELFDFSFNW